MKRLALAIAALVGPLSATALGADMFALTTTAGQGSQVAVAEPAGFDWSGFYAGIFTGARVDSDASPTIGINAGVNAQFDFVLVGAEVAVQGVADPGSTQAYGQILGRAGLIIADDIAVYAAGGYGIDIGTPNSGAPILGGGVELALNDDVTLRAQYLRGFPEQAGGTFQQFTVGAQLQF
jgi:outer membrane immunogenic protein